MGLLRGFAGETGPPTRAQLVGLLPRLASPCALCEIDFCRSQCRGAPGPDRILTGLEPALRLVINSHADQANPRQERKLGEKVRNQFSSPLCPVGMQHRGRHLQWAPWTGTRDGHQGGWGGEFPAPAEEGTQLVPEWSPRRCHPWYGSGATQLFPSTCSARVPLVPEDRRTPLHHPTASSPPGPHPPNLAGSQLQPDGRKGGLSRDTTFLSEFGARRRKSDLLCLFISEARSTDHVPVGSLGRTVTWASIIIKGKYAN